VLAVGPGRVRSRHPQHAVVDETRARLGKARERLPVAIGADAVASQIDDLVERVTETADRRRRTRRTLADARTLVEHGNAQFGAARQLPGNGQADDPGTGDHDVVLFHAGAPPL